MSRILRAPLARNDLLDIWAYIADQSSASIADGVLARIYGALEVVASAPYVGRERAEFAGSPRSIVVRPSSTSRCRRATGSPSGGCCTGRG